MIVIADTSPINYLVLIGHVLIPPAVYGELLAPSAPPAVQSWIRSLPGWVEIRTPPRQPDSLPLQLGAGEAEAILLAQVCQAPLLLMDERRGRPVAQRLGLQVTGTLGILSDAHHHGLLLIGEAIEKLRQTNFQATPELLDNVLRSTV